LETVLSQIDASLFTFKNSSLRGLVDTTRFSLKVLLFKGGRSLPLSGRLKMRIAALRQTAVDDGNDSSAIVGGEQAPILDQSF